MLEANRDNVHPAPKSGRNGALFMTLTLFQGACNRTVVVGFFSQIVQVKFSWRLLDFLVF